ncbi:MAG: RdgB/HAM1 family non-canonical purine NTP pyrophosphatase [Acidobacteria bacterium]|nr:MAG: RdgB/HAM1 family non-canonical purine NTP pyrophosphatase [Acidobacteriota bacterium]
MLGKLLIATTNRGKVEEIRHMLQPLGIELVFPNKEIPVEEKGCSFLENAYLKARAYYEVFRVPSLGEDSGLVVPALDGYPGIYSSRFYSIEWGGVEPLEDGRDKANIRKLLKNMEKVSDRRAYFVSFMVICLENGGGLWSEGRCEGEILREPRGSGGFGYDPVFKPMGYEKSMAELSIDEKNLISHRGKALNNILKLLK